MQARRRCWCTPRGEPRRRRPVEPDLARTHPAQQAHEIGQPRHELLDGVVDDLMHRLDHQSTPTSWTHVSRLAAPLRLAPLPECVEAGDVLARGRWGWGPRTSARSPSAASFTMSDDEISRRSSRSTPRWTRRVGQVQGHPIEVPCSSPRRWCFANVVARVALEHHEKPDGSGYPRERENRDPSLRAPHQRRDTVWGDGLPRAHRLPMLPYQAMRVVMDDGAKGMLDWDWCNPSSGRSHLTRSAATLKLEAGDRPRGALAAGDPEKPVIRRVADASGTAARSPSRSTWR